jgi:hypothetical protein
MAGFFAKPNSWLRWQGLKIFFQDFFHNRGWIFVSLTYQFYRMLKECNFLFDQGPLAAQSVVKYLNLMFWSFFIFLLREQINFVTKILV